MASPQNTNLDDTSLKSSFKSIWDTYIMIDNTEESTSSDKIQGVLRKALAKAEEAIYMVNQLQLFSDNEEIEEVATNELKYMLLPALLGHFHGLNTHAARMETVIKSKSHYRDFLGMVKAYGVTSQHIPLDTEEDGEPGGQQLVPVPRSGGVTAMDLGVMGSQRNSKIERFRQSKEYDGRLKELTALVEREHADEEIKREFYLTQIKRWINSALDEMENLNTEIQILRHMEERKKQGKSPQGGSRGATGAKPEAKKAFRPFILTKDALQKQVYGLGYPGIPTMSIEEFYQEKVDDGTFSIPTSAMASTSMQGRVDEPERAAEEMEREDVERERRVENDDEELIARARSTDEYKDTHRTGWGNRHNMG